jgi:hypothetical protein
MRRPTILILYCAVPVLLWLAAGFSLGWYYTFTYYGRQGWPMPLLETSGALIAYYFSVLNVDTRWQAIHWMAIFPITAIIWVAVLRWSARLVDAAKPSWRRLLMATAAAALPLALPGPWLAWLAGTKYGAFEWETMIKIALRRDGYSPWNWLSPMYFSLGLAGLALELTIFTRGRGATARQLAIHYLVSAIIYTVACCAAAAVLAWPLRNWLE